MHRLPGRSRGPHGRQPPARARAALLLAAVAGRGRGRRARGRVLRRPGPGDRRDRHRGDAQRPRRLRRRVPDAVRMAVAVAPVRRHRVDHRTGVRAGSRVDAAGRAARARHRPGAGHALRVADRRPGRRRSRRWPGAPARPSARASPPPADPSGEPVPGGDLPGFKQVFSDDFAVDVPLGRFPAAVASRWWAYPSTFRDTSGQGTYDCARVCSVAGGVLKLHLHTEDGVREVAAPVPRLPGSAPLPPHGIPSGRSTAATRSASAQMRCPGTRRWRCSGPTRRSGRATGRSTSRRAPWSGR